MRVLWLCNIMLPLVAEALGKDASNKEGWLTGLAEELLKHAEENKIELGICFPVGKGEEPVKGRGQGFSYFGFREDVSRPEVYDPALEGQLKEILQEFQPDLIHVFGTEYPHTLAMTKCVEDPARLLIGLQGLCFLCAQAYMADLPERVQKRYLFRDLLKQDNIAKQQEKFAMRGENEKEALRRALHVAGRTAFDRQAVEEVNPGAAYHFMNETLRPVFYGPRWQLDACERYSIFISQGSYPLKGLHYLLRAMPDILAAYPRAKAYVAGDVITRYGTLKEKLKIGSYGKYCLDLIRQNRLEDHIVFLGKLNSEQMCSQYLKSHVFLSPSALENSPNSVGEAMLLGMPVVSSDAGGVSSMLTSGQEGILYPAGDVSGLKKAVCTLFADDKLAAAYGEKAHARAVRTHDPLNNYRRLLEIYAALQAGACGEKKV